MSGYSSMRQAGNSWKKRIKYRMKGRITQHSITPKASRRFSQAASWWRGLGVQYDQHPEDGSPPDWHPTACVPEKIRAERSYNAEKKSPEGHFPFLSQTSENPTGPMAVRLRKQAGQLWADDTTAVRRAHTAKCLCVFEVRKFCKVNVIQLKIP